MENAVLTVPEVRARYPASTLADLYYLVPMAPSPAKADAAQDRAVGRCYRKESLLNDRTRMKHLFALYDTLTAQLVAAASSLARKPKTASL